MDKDLKQINCHLSMKKLAPMLRAAFEMCKEEPKKGEYYEYTVTWPPKWLNNMDDTVSLPSSKWGE